MASRTPLRWHESLAVEAHAPSSKNREQTRDRVPEWSRDCSEHVLEALVSRQAPRIGHTARFALADARVVSLQHQQTAA
jgi:hypothetical protein